MKKTTFLSVTLLATAITFGQGSSYNLPKIIPPSPTAQTFMRYGEIPVDFSTGVPNIEIPIYTVEGRQLKVPISISYHASGIKVNDIASEVGLGWALNCGGLVSRTINGKRDEALAMPRTYDNAAALLNAVNSTTGGFDQSSNCLYGLRDFEDFFNRYFSGDEGDPMKDRFFYKLPTGLSGVFTYDYVSGDPITMPYRHLKIEKNVDASSGFPRINNLKITDDNGIVYTFITVLTNSTQNYSEWFIKDMTSADGTDKITFNYVLQSANPSVPGAISQAYQGMPENVASTCTPNNPVSKFSSSITPLPQFTTPVLESIVSSKAIVKFEYAGRDDFNYLKRLTRITIAPVNSPTDIIKQADFTPKYFGATPENKRLGLDAVIIGTPNSQPQKYTFSYESQELPPYPFKMTTPLYSEDYWGYYNGNNTGNGKSLIPFDFIVNTTDRQYYGGNREAGDYYYSRACMLKEIKYPTGGKTIFDFERYYSTTAYPYHTDPAAQDGYYGGFRVASVTNYSDDNVVANVKMYEYELPVTRQIQIAYFNYDQFFIEASYKEGNPDAGLPGTSCYSTFSRDMVYPNPLLPLEVAPGMPIMYQQVTEYNGTPAQNAGKTVYTYSLPYLPSDFLNNPDHPYEFEAPQFYHPYHYDKGNYVPELRSKTVYSFDGTYHPISKEGYEYSKLFANTFNTGIKLSRTLHFPSIDYWCNVCFDVTQGCSSRIFELVNQYKTSVVAIDTKAYQEASLLTNSKSYVYDPLDETKFVLASTDYAYNVENLAIKEKTTISSKGEVLKTAYKYPHDNTGMTVYSTMVSRNILSPAIEEQHYRNSNFLQSTKTNYDFWNGSAWSTSPTNVIVPRTVETQFLSSAPRLRLRYHSYDDNRNVMSVSNENDVKKSYIWAYNKNYPIAELLNAEAKDVFHTSFEDAEGNVFDGKTGKKSRVGGYSRAISNLTNGTYVLSWWQKNGSAWVLQMNTNIAVTNGTYSINLAGQVDEVRFYPAKAQMTTYAYDPLIGMISQCDLNNRITYFEYDNLGRLSFVRDHDRNIIKKFRYNYAGQPDDCSYLVNSDQSGNYLSQNCGSQTSPVPYYVSVPKGMFTSSISVLDANTKAQQYAQQQADQFGACVPDVAINYTNAGPNCYTVEFYNPATGFDVFFPVEGSSGILGTVPPGIYYIVISSSCDASSRTYHAACKMASGSGSAVFENVTVNSSCHNIGIQ
jgi:hypothetical protein